MLQRGPNNGRSVARTATWGVPLSYWHALPPCCVRLCCIVQRVVEACTVTTLDLTVLHCPCCVGTHCHCIVWHALPMCHVILHCDCVLLACSAIVLCLESIANEFCCECTLPPPVLLMPCGLRQVLLLLFCVHDTAFFIILLHSCLSGM